MRDYSKTREYWQKHSVADEWDSLPNADIEFIRPHKTTISLRIDKDVLDNLKVHADIKGLRYTTYIRSVLTELSNKGSLP